MAGGVTTKKPAMAPSFTASALTDHAAGIVLLHLIMGSLIVGFIEGWRPVDALYFCVTTLTTVGYGDMVPKTAYGRLFTSVHVLLGCLISASCFGTLLGRMQASLREGGKHSSARAQNHEERLRDAARALSTAGAIILTGTVYGMVFEGWSLNNAFYWSVVSCTSVGFGDLTPAPVFRPIAGIYLLLSVGAFASAAAQVARAYAAFETDRQIAAFVSRGVSADLIESLDRDGDGQVTRAEFIRHMLVSSGLVDETEMVKVETLFDALDVDGSGTLDAADIVGAHKPDTPTSKAIPGGFGMTAFALRSMAGVGVASREETSEGSETADEGAAMLPQRRARGGPRGGASL